MKKIILMSLIALLSLKGFATGRGTGEAEKFCDGISSSFVKQDCADLVIKNDFFDFDAVISCSESVTIDINKKSCLEAIQGKTYSQYEARSCQNTNGLVAIQCLKVRGSAPSLEPIPAVRSNTVLRPIFEMQQVLTGVVQSFCRGVAGYVDSCLNEISTNPYIEKSAFSVCQKLQKIYADTPSQMNCLLTVINHKFSEGVDSCKDKGPASSVLGCLNDHMLE